MADANATKIKFTTGKKADIEKAKQDGKLDANDFIVTSDTDELAFINKSGETHFIKDRTDEAVQFKGTSIGNWKDGATVPEGMTFTEWLKQAAQKSISASYLEPTVALANHGGTNSGAVEAGTSITPKVTATFTKNDAGDLTGITVKKGGVNVKEGTASPLNYDGEPIVIGDETISFSATATYKEGAIKNDNLGNPSPDDHIVAGTIASSNYSFIGQRNMFYGTGVGNSFEANSANIRALSNKKLNVTAGYSFTINVAVGQQYVVIAYPATVRDLTKVHYVEGNDPNLASNFKKSVVQVADARGGSQGAVGYKCYSLILSTPVKAPMTLNVTI